MWSFLLCSDCSLRFPGAPDIACPMCGGSTVEASPIATHHTQHAQTDRALVGVIDNVRSVHNVGSMLRSADAFSIEAVHLCGITPPGDHPKIARAALGAEKAVSWQSHRNSIDCCRRLLSQGYRLLALESTNEAIPLAEAARACADAPVAIVVGNEVVGVDPGILELADSIATIAMHGDKRSINVAVAFGVASFALRCQ